MQLVGEVHRPPGDGDVAGDGGCSGGGGGGGGGCGRWRWGGMGVARGVGRGRGDMRGRVGRGLHGSGRGGLEVESLH